MRVCTICDDHFPSYWTSTNQVVTTASHLGRLGVQVDFMIPTLAEHLLLKSEKKLRRICDFYGVEPSFHLRDVFTFWPTNRFRVEKLTHGVTAPLLASFDDYDLVYSRNILPVLLTIARGGRALFETYRLLPKEYPVSAPLFKKIATHPRFLGITTHSEMSRQAFVDAGVPEEKVTALHNGYDPEEFRPELTRDEARRMLGLPQNDFTVVYTGHMTAIKGVEILVDIAELAPDLSFVLVGGPTETDVNRILGYAAEKGVKNVHVMGWVTPNKVPPYLYAADVVIIPPTSRPLREHHRTVLPIKVFNYLAAGRPILAPDLPDTAELLHHGVNALRVTPDDPRAAADALHRLADDPLFAGNLADRAREDSRKYTWEERARKLKEFMEERLAASRSESP